ncbi:hypothetical protein FRACA_2130006 [Frankia canadensis]|uniref:Uncharacterized protein n=1 Tax=Frankia canadensis TaxID=1836972 RepID=A0A2I2KQT6_9ACTN|nr:hypothetical protein FRACA_2130006 [Frankia canadensis]SOU55286.1 hypothetical protein FRACA_2130006 [Frankia canadensis]
MSRTAGARTPESTQRLTGHVPDHIHDPADRGGRSASAGHPDLAGIAVGTFYRARKGRWQHPSPTVWPPPATYREMRELATEILPGCQYRRHLLLRYSIIWHRPTTL